MEDELKQEGKNRDYRKGENGLGLDKEFIYEHL